MNKLLILFIATMLTACEKPALMFDLIFSPDARSLYEAGGMDNIQLTQVSPVPANPATITPIVYQTGWAINLATCSTYIDIQPFDPNNVGFWQLQPFQMTFDPDSFSCGQTYTCSADFTQQGTTAAGDFTCVEKV